MRIRENDSDRFPMRKINKLQYAKTEITTSHNMHKLHSGKFAKIRSVLLPYSSSKSFISLCLHTTTTHINPHFL